MQGPLPELNSNYFFGDGGFKILFLAVAYGPIETIQYLLENKATLNLNLSDRSARCYTILHSACYFRKMDVVELVYQALQKENIHIDFDFKDPNSSWGEFYHSPLEMAGYGSLLMDLHEKYPKEITPWLKCILHRLYFVWNSQSLQLLKYVAQFPEFDEDFHNRKVKYIGYHTQPMTPLQYA